VKTCWLWQYGSHGGFGGHLFSVTVSIVVPKVFYGEEVCHCIDVDRVLLSRVDFGDASGGWSNDSVKVRNRSPHHIEVVWE
jgi:hypothetical protein